MDHISEADYIWVVTQDFHYFELSFEYLLFYRLHDFDGYVLIGFQIDSFIDFTILATAEHFKFRFAYILARVDN